MMAYTSFYQLIQDIKRDIGKIGNKIARGVAEIAYDDMQEAHSSIIDSYYGGYTPVSSYTYYYYSPSGEFYSGRSHGYRRTGNLRKSIIPQGVTGSGHSFTARIQVGPMQMDGYINSTGRVFPADAVFDLIWDQGIRGLPPGYRGHIGDVTISAAPVGIGISGKPDDAMNQFMDSWWSQRGSQMADMIAGSI